MESNTTNQAAEFLYNAEMEKGILGIMIMDPINTIPEVKSSLLPESFYLKSNNIIFKAIVDIHQAGNAVDLVTLNQKLKDQGNLEKVGGPAYLIETLDDVFTTAHLKDYIRELNGKAVLRNCWAELKNATVKIRNDPGTLRQVLDEIRDGVEGYSRSLDLSGRPIPSMRDIMAEVETMIFEERYRPIPTFSEGLNWNLNGGFHPGKNYVISGGAGGGKTTLVHQMLDEIARANREKRDGETKSVVIYVHMEQGHSEMLVKTYSRLAEINSRKFETGDITPDNPAVKEARKIYINEIGPYFYIIEGREGMTVRDIREIVRKVDSQIEYPHQILLCVDPFQRLRTGDRNLDGDETSRVGAVSSWLKMLARDLKIPVILLSDTTKAEVKKFAEGDSNIGTAIRGSYMPEHVADVSAVILSGGPEKLKKWGNRSKKAGHEVNKYDRMEELCDRYIQEERELYPCYACLDFSKQRSGPTSSVLFLYKKALNTFIPQEKLTAKPDGWGEPDSTIDNDEAPF